MPRFLYNILFLVLYCSLLGPTPLIMELLFSLSLWWHKAGTSLNFFEFFVVVNYIIRYSKMPSWDNLIGQNVINRWYRLAYQNQNSCFVRHAMRISTKISFTRLTHVLWKCFVCPQNVNLPISIWLYSTTKLIVFILKSIWAFGSVLIAHDHAQNE